MGSVTQNQLPKQAITTMTLKITGGKAGLRPCEAHCRSVSLQYACPVRGKSIPSCWGLALPLLMDLHKVPKGRAWHNY